MYSVFVIVLIILLSLLLLKLVKESTVCVLCVCHRLNYIVEFTVAEVSLRKHCLCI